MAAAALMLRGYLSRLASAPADVPDEIEIDADEGGGGGRAEGAS